MKRWAGTAALVAVVSLALSAAGDAAARKFPGISEGITTQFGIRAPYASATLAAQHDLAGLLNN